MGIILFLFLLATVLVSAGTLVILLAVLLVPVDLMLSGTFSDGTASSRWRVTWGWISLQSTGEGEGDTDVCILGHRVLRIKQAPKRPVARPKPEEPAEYFPGTFIAVLPLIPEGIGILRKRMTLHRLDCSLAFGLAGPAATGTLYGWLCAVRGALSCFPNVNLALDPVFDRQCLDMRIRLVLRIRHPLLAVIDARRILRKAQAIGDPAKPLPERDAMPS